jgi:hypothetical protein
MALPGSHPTRICLIQALTGIIEDCDFLNEPNDLINVLDAIAMP